MVSGVKGFYSPSYLHDIDNTAQNIDQSSGLISEGAPQSSQGGLLVCLVLADIILADIISVTISPVQLR